MTFQENKSQLSSPLSFTFFDEETPIIEQATTQVPTCSTVRTENEITDTTNFALYDRTFKLKPTFHHQLKFAIVHFENPDHVADAICSNNFLTHNFFEHASSEVLEAWLSCTTRTGSARTKARREARRKIATSLREDWNVIRLQNNEAYEADALLSVDEILKRTTIEYQPPKWLIQDRCRVSESLDCCDSVCIRKNPIAHRAAINEAFEERKALIKYFVTENSSHPNCMFTCWICKEFIPYARRNPDLLCQKHQFMPLDTPLAPFSIPHPYRTELMHCLYDPFEIADLIQETADAQNDTLNPSTVNILCPICRTACSDQQNYLAHCASTDHRNILNEIVNSPLQKCTTHVFCSLCNRKFTSMTSAQQHVKGKLHNKSKQLMISTQNKALIWVRKINLAAPKLSQPPKSKPADTNSWKSKDYQSRPAVTPVTKDTNSWKSPHYQSRPQVFPQAQMLDLESDHPTSDPGQIDTVSPSDPETEHDTTFEAPDTSLSASVQPRTALRTTLDAAPSAYTEILSNPVMYYKFNWNVSDADDKTILSFTLFSSHANSHYANMPFNHKTILGMHQYYRGDTKIKILINGNPFLAGQLVLGYIPPVAYGRATTWIDFAGPAATKYTAADLQYNASAMSQLTHKAYINATDPTAVELTIPFMYNQDFFNFGRNAETLGPHADASDPLSSLGSVQLCVVNQLSISPDAAQYIECKVFISYENVQMYQQIQTSNIPKPVANAQILNLETITDGITGAIGGVLNVLETGAALVSTVAGFFDKPENLQPTPNFYVTHPTDWQYGKGLDSSIHFASRPGIQVSVDQDFLSAFPPLDPIALATNNPHLISSFQIKPDASPSQVYSMSVTPVYDQFRKNTGTENFLSIGSWLSVTSSTCAYWTGSITYIIQVIKPVPSTVRLMAVHDTYNLYSETLDIEDATIFENKIIDFSKDINSAEFTVTVKNSTQWFQTFGPEDQFDDKIQRNNFINGVFRLYVVNAPSMPSNVVADIRVNVFIKPGPDFKLQAPGFGYSIHPALSVEPIPTLAQINDVEYNFGETFDLDSTLKKSYYTHSFTFKNNLTRPKTNLYFQFSLNDLWVFYMDDSGVQQKLNLEGTGNRNVARIFKEMTAGVRGSRIIRIVSNIPFAKVIVKNSPSMNVTQPMLETDDYGTVSFNANNAQTISASVPYMSRNKWFPNEGNPNFPDYDFDLVPVSFVHCTLRMPSIEEDEYIINIYEAYGDDFLPVVPFLPSAHTDASLTHIVPNMISTYRSDSPAGWTQSPVFRNRTSSSDLENVVQTLDLPESTPDSQILAHYVESAAAKIIGKCTDLKKEAVNLPKQIAEEVGRGIGQGAGEGAIDAVCDFVKRVRKQPDADMNNPLPCITEFFANAALEGINIGILTSNLMHSKSIAEVGKNLVHFMVGVPQFREFFTLHTLEILTWFTSASTIATENITQSSDDGFFAPLVNLFVKFAEYIGKCPLAELGNFLNKNCSGIFHLGRFITACKSILSLFTWLKDTFVWLWNKTKQWINGDGPEIPLLERVNVVIDEINNLELNADNLDYVPELNQLPHLREIEYNVYHLRTELQNNPILFRSPVYNALNRVIPKISKVTHDYQKIMDRTGARADPFCLCFVGAPGAGKSGSAFKIITDLAHILDIKALNLIYPRNAADQYWSRYQSEPFTLIDDFLQRMDPEACQEFITLKSNIPFALNMADTSEKGKMFNSKYLVLTTNTAYPKPVGIVSSEALLRRRDILVEVKPKSKLDFKPNQKIDREQLQHLTFTIKDSLVDKEIITLDYIPFLDYVAKRIITFEAAQSVLLKSYETVTEGVDELKAKIDVAARAQNDDVDSDSDSDYETSITNPRKLEFAKPKISKLKFQQLIKAKNEIFLKGNQFKSDLELEYTDPEAELIDNEIIRREKLMKKIINLGTFDLPTPIKPLEIDPSLDPISSCFEELKYYLPNLDRPIRFLRANGEPHPDHFDYHDVTAAFDVAKELTELLYPDDCNTIQWKKIWINFLGESWFNEHTLNSFENLKIDLSQIRSQAGRVGVEIRQLRADRYANRFRFLDAIRNHPIIASIVALSSIALGYLIANPPKSFISAQVYEMPGHNYIKRPPVAGTTQASDANSQSLGESIFLKNSAMLTYDSRRGTKAFANVVFVDGAMILMNKHTAKDIAEDAKLTFTTVGELNSVSTVETFESRRLQLHPVSDYAIYCCSPRTQARRAITQHFITNEELIYLQGQDVTTYSFSNTSAKHHYTGNIVERMDRIMLNEAGNGLTCYRNAFQYAAPTPNGTSGSIILINDPKINHKVLGIHAGGNLSTGAAYGMLITKQDLLSLINNLTTRFNELRGSEPDAQNLYLTTDDYRPTDFPQGNFLHLGYLKPEFCMNTLDRTDFKPSLLHGKIYDIQTKPPLSYRQSLTTLGRDSMRQSVEKYGHVLKPWHPKDVDDLQIDVIRQFTTGKPFRPPQLATHEEILFGNDHYAYMDAINWDSSPGFPLILKRTGKGKRCFITEDNELREDLAALVSHRESEAKQGRRVISLWTDCKKDQRLPCAKVDNGKCRAFTICPFDYTYLFRKYFLDFAVFFYQNHLKQPHAVGINPEGPDWSDLFYKLSGFSNQCINGDFGKYDGTLMNDAIYTMLLTANEYYKDDYENQLVRAVLIEELFFNTHLWYNAEIKRWVCYQTIQGNPSGNPATVILNTIVNAFYHQGAWKDVHRIQRCSEIDPKVKEYYEQVGFHFKPLTTNPSSDSFHQHVLCCFYGDDDICAVKPEAAIYNQHNIALVFREHGLDYTAATKEESTYEFIPILQADFLKREFLVDDRYPHVVHSPMNEANVIDLVNWIRTAPDHAEALRENLRDFCRFEYQHGREHYDARVQPVRRHALDVLQQTLPTYDEIDYDLLRNYQFDPATPHKDLLLLAASRVRISDLSRELDPVEIELPTQ